MTDSQQDYQLPLVIPDELLDTESHPKEKKEPKAKALPKDLGDPQEREKLIEHLTSYGAHERFSLFLVNKGYDLTHKNLAKMSQDELNDLYNSVRRSIAQRTSQGMLPSVVFQVVNGLEVLTVNNQHFCLKGLKQILADDQIFNDALAEISITNGFILSTNPIYRLVFSLISGVGICVTLNKVAVDKSQPRAASEIKPTGFKKEDKIVVPKDDQQPLPNITSELEKLEL